MTLNDNVRVDTSKVSKQRQRWFQTGYEQGPTSCGTFDVPAAQL